MLRTAIVPAMLAGVLRTANGPRHTGAALISPPQEVLRTANGPRHTGAALISPPQEPQEVKG